jgi:hypothetical protein
MLQGQRLCDAKDLTRRNITHHDLVTLGGSLLDAQMPMQQYKEGDRIGALLEHRGILRIPDRTRLAQNLIEVSRRQPGKQRDIGHNRAVNCRHLPSPRMRQWNHGDSSETLRQLKSAPPIGD